MSLTLNEATIGSGVFYGCFFTTFDWFLERSWSEKERKSFELHKKLPLYILTNGSMFYLLAITTNAYPWFWKLLGLMMAFPLGFLSGVVAYASCKTLKKIIKN